jgi:hypothetical protein
MESGVKTYDKREVFGILRRGVRKNVNVTVAIQSRRRPTAAFPH